MDYDEFGQPINMRPSSVAPKTVIDETGGSLTMGGTPPVAAAPQTAAVRPPSMATSSGPSLGGYVADAGSEIASAYQQGGIPRAVGATARAAAGYVPAYANAANELTMKALRPIGNVAKGVYQGLTGGPEQPPSAVTAPPPTAVQPVQARAPAALQATLPATLPAALPAPSVANVGDEAGGVTSPELIAPPSAVRNLPFDPKRFQSNTGGLYGVALALAAGRAQNSQNRFDFKNQIAAGEANANIRGKELSNEKAQFDVDRAKKLAALDEMIANDDGTDPVRTKRLEKQRMAIVGKSSPDARLQISTYEEPIDPANPMAGTRKIPVAIDAQGNAKFIRPPSEANAMAGMKQVGTSNGVPVYEDKDGKRFTQ